MFHNFVRLAAIALAGGCFSCTSTPFVQGSASRTGCVGKRCEHWSRV